MIATCNRCGKDFPLDPYYIDTIRDGDIEVQYFSCPVCGSRYHILTTDAAMRRLIQKRKALTAEIKAARAKGFRKEALRTYRKKLAKIKVEQCKMETALKKTGEAILKGDANGKI